MLAILLTLSILLCFAACGQIVPQVSEVEVLSELVSSDVAEIESAEPTSSFSQEDSPSAADQSTASKSSAYSNDVSSEESTSEAMQRAKEEFCAFADSLQVDSIGKMRVSIDSGLNHQTLDTSDPRIIQRWIEIVKAIKIELVQRYISRDGGGGPYLDFYDQGGNLCGRCSFLTLFTEPVCRLNQSSMELAVTGYDYDKTMRLMRDMGFDGMHTGMVLPYPEEVTSEVLQNAPAEFYSFINSLRVENISQISLISNETKDACSPDMIQKWLGLFSSIKIGSAQPFGGYQSGHGKSFYIWGQNKNKIGSFAIWNGLIIFDLNNADQLTQLVIEEIDDDLLKQWMREMGFSKDSINW